MKRKTCVAVLAMCLMLAAGCGNNGSSNEDSTKTEDTKTDITQDTDMNKSSQDSDTRLVSVDDIDKYITLGEYKGIVLTKSNVQVTDEDVDNRVTENLKDNMKEVTQKGATVQDGDAVTINFVGKKDGVAFEGGSGNNYDLTIGDGTMIPGFEEGIIGMKKGDTKDVEVTFPENYRQTDLAGQDAVFQITLQSFRRAPEFTDEWVTDNTDYANMEEYKAGVRTQLEAEAVTNADQALKTQAWSQVFSNSEIKEYPQADMDEASAEYKRLVQKYADQAGMKLEEFVESQGLTTEDFDSQCQYYAQQKVKQNLIVQKIMDAEGIALDDEECLAIQDQILQQSGAGDMAVLIDTYGQAAVDETIGLLRIEDFLVANANVEQTEAATEAEATGADAANTETTDTEATGADTVNTDTADTDATGADSTEAQ